MSSVNFCETNPYLNSSVSAGSRIGAGTEGLFPEFSKVTLARAVDPLIFLHAIDLSMETDNKADFGWIHIYFMYKSIFPV